METTGDRSYPLSCKKSKAASNPVLLFPSEKNQSSAKFLDLDLSTYSQDFEKFVKKIHDITGDVLITSPSDFSGLNEFLQNSSN